MLGVPGNLSLNETIRLFQDTQAAGLIVFRRNFPNAAGFRTWLSALENALERRLLVAVDHEGGRVIHLQEGVTYFPDNLALGWTGSEEYARRQGEMEAAELRRLGIDLNLAPTLDVLTAAYSPNIGIRSYGKDAQLVSRLGTARIRAMQAGGLSACAKHFPGQGQSSLDAHLDLPVLPTDKKEFDAIHSLPFKAAIQAGVDTVMTSHPVYSALDPSAKIPATFSRTIAHGFLREELGFQGVILSDDLEMGALKHFGNIGNSAVQAVKAGHDMILICSDPAAAREAAQKLTQAYSEKEIPMRELEASCERLQRLLAKREERFSGPVAFAEPQGKPLALKIAQAGLMRWQTAEGQTPAGKMHEDEKTLVLYPRISVLGERIAMEPEMQNDEAFIRQLFESAKGVFSFLTLALDPDMEEQEAILQAAAGAGQTLFFCFDPHLYPASRKLLNALEEKIPNLTVIFLRDPFGADLLAKKTPYFYAFGFRSAQIRAAVNFFCHPESFYCHSEQSEESRAQDKLRRIPLRDSSPLTNASRTQNDKGTEP